MNTFRAQGRFTNTYNFADNGKQYNLVFSTYVKTPFVYNTQLVDPNQISHSSPVT